MGRWRLLKMAFKPKEKWRHHTFVWASISQISQQDKITSMESESSTPHAALHREQGRYALVAGYIAIWLLMSLLTTAALGYMSSIQEQLRDIVAIHNTKKDLVKQMHASSRERVFSLQYMLLIDDPFERDAESIKIYQNGTKFNEAREQFLRLPLDPPERSIMDKHELLAGRAAPTQRDVINLIMRDETERARHILLDEVTSIQQQALALLGELEEYQDSSIKSALQRAESAYTKAGYLLIFLGGIAVILLIAIAVKVFSVMRVAAQALHDEKDRLRVTLHSIGDGVVATDSSGIIEYINPAAEQLTGWSKEAAVGTSIFETFKVINTATGMPVASTISELIDETRITDIHHHSLLRRKDGSTLAVDYTASAIHHNDGKIGGYVTVFRDESELREMAHHLSHQATHDPLTNLANRRQFEHRLELLLKQNEGSHGEHVLCYLDLDHFKIVNDTCGHAAGDELLKQVVTLFRQKVRTNDLLARIGGDEFGLLLENCPVERALGITEEIRKSIQQYRFIWNGQIFHIGVSIGMVAIDKRWRNLPELLAAADAACYAAKDGGRNRVHLYLTGNTGRESGEESSWPERIRMALGQERLLHYYQIPVPLRPSPSTYQLIDLQLRIQEQGRQRLPLAPLLQYAERHGLAAQIDRCAVEHALMLALLREDKNAVYTIPLSAASLQDKSFATDIVGMATVRCIPPAQLCLEIPESFLIANPGSAGQAAQALIDEGFRIALDGTGRSFGSLEALRSMPFEHLRIAGDFIHQAMEDALLHIQLEAIVRMAHNMGIRVIAMDIQSRQMIGQLEEIGIDYMSGHGIDKPQPAIALLINEYSEHRYESRQA